MSKLSSIIHLFPEGTAKPEGAFLQVNLVGKEIQASPPVGTNLAPKNCTLIGFQDEEKSTEALKCMTEKAERSFDVHSGSEKVLKKSGLDVSSVKAVLVINGCPTIEDFRTMMDDPAMEPLILSFGEQKGLIVKHFLLGKWGQNIGGGCYFFECEEDIEAYLSSEFWTKCVTETPWENVTYEKYSVEFMSNGTY